MAKPKTGSVLARSLLLFVGWLCLKVQSARIAPTFGIPFSSGIGRRDAIDKILQLFGFAGVAVGQNGPTRNDDIASESLDTISDKSTGLPLEKSTPGLAMEVYRIMPDASKSLDPSLGVLSKQELVRILVDKTTSGGGAIWLGEHHNSMNDHVIQADLVRSIHQARSTRFVNDFPPMAVGLEQVQVQFQPALDEYVADVISEEELKQRVQWDTRWSWPFDAYRPVFETAKELGIQLLALNVDSEDLAQVEKAGFPGLEKSRVRKYITDPYGFADFAKPPEFRAYVDYVIRPSFDLHKNMGLLRYTVSGQKLDNDMQFVNFFSGRILWDEAMASAAHVWTQDNPRGLLIGLVGADHVKFEAGIPGRFTRMAGASRDCTSIILNPTLVDTRPPGSVMNVPGAGSSQFPDRLTLQLRYLKEGVDLTSEEALASPDSTGGVLSLADYIVIGQ